MTAINWLYADDNMLGVAADTMISTCDDAGRCGPPVNFTAKIFPLPHLHAVMFGTGCSRLTLEWFRFIHSDVIGRDVGILLELAPKFLPDMQQELKRAGLSVAGPIETAIYHAGFDTAGTLGTYVHRSENNFVLEELPPGLFMRPGYPELRERFDVDVRDNGVPIPEAFVRLIAGQRDAERRQRQARGEEHVGIGGEVHFLTMSQHTHSLWNCYRFDDFDAEFEKVLEWSRL